jgi:hypothetical protein
VPRMDRAAAVPLEQGAKGHGGQMLGVGAGVLRFHCWDGVLAVPAGALHLDDSAGSGAHLLLQLSRV